MVWFFQAVHNKTVNISVLDAGTYLLHIDGIAKAIAIPSWTLTSLVRKQESLFAKLRQLSRTYLVNVLSFEWSPPRMNDLSKIQWHFLSNFKFWDITKTLSQPTS